MFVGVGAAKRGSGRAAATAAAAVELVGWVVETAVVVTARRVAVLAMVAKVVRVAGMEMVAEADLVEMEVAGMRVMGMAVAVAMESVTEAEVA